MNDVYTKLARRLDAIPNGFPATASGVELRLLAKIFAPEEAALAAEMRLGYETADAIAARAGIDPQEAARRLKTMVRKGQIRVRRGDGGLAFALMPFVVGIYEEQVARMDQELARLVEQYFQEVSGRVLLSTAPAIHRVVPVGESLAVGLEVLAYEDAASLVESAQAWGVRDCICRLQKRLIGEGCNHTLETCLLMAPLPGVFDGSVETRAISKEEALRLLKKCEEEGLVHTIGNYRDRHYYICNCCPCCCGVLRGVTEFGVPAAVAHSGFLAVVDAESCTGCGTCVDRCPFQALDLLQDVAVVNLDRCLGCGVCTPTCPSAAIRLERRQDEEGATAAPPADIKDWMARRAKSRQIPLEGIFR